MRFTLKSVLCLSLFTGFASLAAMPSQADPVTYLFTAIVSGTVESTAFATPNMQFTNKLLDLTASGDTSSVTSGGGSYYNQVGNIGVGLFGVGFGVSTDTFQAFDTQSIPSAGLIDNSNFDVYSLKSPAFSTYDLKSSLGPLFTSFYGVPFPAPLSTSFGLITFDSIKDTTFTAVVSGPAVPEASSVVSLGLLLALGMGGVVVASRKRKSLSL